MPANIRQQIVAFMTAIRDRFRAFQHVPFATVIPFFSILAVLISITSALLLGFWWSLIIVLLMIAVIVIVLWRRLPVVWRLPPAVSRVSCALGIIVLAVAVLWSPMRAKYLKEYPPPSVVYVTPGVWLSLPVPQWRMVVNHCGPAPLYNVVVYFQDLDRTQAFAGRPTITPNDIAASEIDLGPFPEIDPTQSGPMFNWSPLNPDHENYTVGIGSRDSVFDESLQIERVTGKWYFRMTVSDVTASRHIKIIDCRDAGFSVSPTEEHLPACFPQYVAGEHWNSCG